MNGTQYWREGKEVDRITLSARHNYDRSKTRGRRKGIEKKEHATLYSLCLRENVWEKESESVQTKRTKEQRRSRREGIASINNSNEGGTEIAKKVVSIQKGEWGGKENLQRGWENKWERNASEFKSSGVSLIMLPFILAITYWFILSFYTFMRRKCSSGKWIVSA